MGQPVETWPPGKGRAGKQGSTELEGHGELVASLKAGVWLTAFYTPVLGDPTNQSGS